MERQRLKKVILGALTGAVGFVATSVVPVFAEGARSNNLGASASPDRARIIDTGNIRLVASAFCQDRYDNFYPSFFEAVRGSPVFYLQLKGADSGLSLGLGFRTEGPSDLILLNKEEEARLRLGTLFDPTKLNSQRDKKFWGGRMVDVVLFGGDQAEVVDQKTIQTPRCT